MKKIFYALTREDEGKIWHIFDVKKQDDIRREIKKIESKYKITIRASRGILCVCGNELFDERINFQVVEKVGKSLLGRKICKLCLKKIKK